MPVDHHDEMNITRRSSKIVSAVVSGVSLAALGGGIAYASPAPSAFISDQALAVQSDGVVSRTVTAEDKSSLISCDFQHPYLVLDNAADNASRFFRHATFHTGDNKPLHLGESIVPVGPSLGPNFTGANVAVLFDGSSRVGGHTSVTIYCASTLEAAHQK